MKVKKVSNVAAKVADKLGAWMLLIVIAVIMVFASDKFLTVDNLLNVFRQIAVVCIGAIGVSLVILGGGFDLSTGMIATFAGCNAAIFMKSFGWNMFVAMAVAVLIGVVCAIITALGVWAGKMLASAAMVGKRAEVLGGCVLIGIGLKILYEHGIFS